MSAPDRIPFVHLEHFHPRETESSENVEFTVYAAASDIEFIVPADESILMAADFEGVVVPGDCMEGTCGSCETRVLLGQVEHRDSILSPQDRASLAHDDDLRLPCQAGVHPPRTGPLTHPGRQRACERTCRGEGVERSSIQLPIGWGIGRPRPGSGSRTPGRRKRVRVGCESVFDDRAGVSVDRRMAAWQ